MDGVQRHILVTGELDQASVPVLNEEVLRHLDAGETRVRIDLSSLTSCDSAGVALFLRLHQHAAKLGGELVLANPTPRVRLVFKICSLDTMVAIETDAPTIEERAAATECASTEPGQAPGGLRDGVPSPAEWTVERLEQLHRAVGPDPMDN